MDPQTDQKEKNHYFTQRQIQREKEILAERMSSYSPDNSEATRFFTELFGGTLCQKEMLKLARIASFFLGIHLDREATRRKSVMIKWFDENLELIRPFISKHVFILGSNGKIIGKDKDDPLLGKAMSRFISVLAKTK